MRELDISFDERYAMGPVIVFLHGFPDTSSMWDEIIEEIPKNYHILNIGLPRSKSSFKRIKNDIKSIIMSVKNSDSRKIYLVGHDIGCFFLNEISDEMKVTKVININGYQLAHYFKKMFSSFDQFRRSLYVLFLQLPLIDKLATLFGKHLARKVYSISGTKNNDINFVPIYLYKDLFRLALLRNFKDKTKQATPTMIVHGKDDLFLSIPKINETRSFYSTSQIVRIKGGHWLPRTHQYELNEIIKHYFNINTIRLCV